LLIILLGLGLTVVVTMGVVLAPVLTAIVLAYLLQGLIGVMVRRRVPQSIAFLLTYVLFLAAQAVFLFVLVPLTWGQLVRLVNDQLPHMLVEANAFLNGLPQRYPEIVSADAAKELSSFTTQTVTGVVQSVLS